MYFEFFRFLKKTRFLHFLLILLFRSSGLCAAHVNVEIGEDIVPIPGGDHVFSETSFTSTFSEDFPSSHLRYAYSFEHASEQRDASQL